MSAPTTAEVRRALAAEWHSAREHGDSEANGAAAALEAYALPIAEHRDALAAEVARLRAEIRSAHERIDLCAEEPIDATWTWPLSRRIDALDSLVDTIARKEERDEAQALYSELRAERDAARTELAAVKAERDEARGELQWQVRPAHIAVSTDSTDSSSVEALHVPSGVKVRGGSRSEVLYRCQEERATRAEAERDALAAEVQRSREQKPVRWAVVARDGDIVGTWCVAADARSIAESHERERDTLRTVALPIAEERDALAAEVARLRARLECGASPYGVHRCVHCDSEVT